MRSNKSVCGDFYGLERKPNISKKERKTGPSSDFEPNLVMQESQLGKEDYRKQRVTLAQLILAETVDYGP